MRMLTKTVGVGLLLLVALGGGGASAQARDEIESASSEATAIADAEDATAVEIAVATDFCESLWAWYFEARVELHEARVALDGIEAELGVSDEGALLDFQPEPGTAETVASPDDALLAAQTTLAEAEAEAAELETALAECPTPWSDWEIPAGRGDPFGDGNETDPVAQQAAGGTTTMSGSAPTGPCVDGNRHLRIVNGRSLVDYFTDVQAIAYRTNLRQEWLASPSDRYFKLYGLIDAVKLRYSLFCAWMQTRWEYECVSGRWVEGGKSTVYIPLAFVGVYEHVIVLKTLAATQAAAIDAAKKGLMEQTKGWIE